MSERIFSFLLLSLFSDSSSNNLVFAITSSCFRRDISASWAVFGGPEEFFFLVPVLLVFGAWKTGALGFSDEDVEACAE